MGNMYATFVARFGPGNGSVSWRQLRQARQRPLVASFSKLPALSAIAFKSGDQGEQFLDEGVDFSRRGAARGGCRKFGAQQAAAQGVSLVGVARASRRIVPGTLAAVGQFRRREAPRLGRHISLSD